MATWPQLAKVSIGPLLLAGDTSMAVAPGSAPRVRASAVRRLQMRQKLSLDSEAAPAAGQCICPKCGLVLQVVDIGERPSFRYDFQAWDRLCRDPLLGGPSACLGRQAGMAARGRRDV